MATAPVSPAGHLNIDIAGLRSTKGAILICLTRDPKHFPDCSGDPAARTLTVAAGNLAAAHFSDIAPGDYALSLIHDENGNGKLDTRLGIPREGIGFSRNPRLMFGPPSFASVRFTIGAAALREPVSVKYFL